MKQRATALTNSQMLAQLCNLLIPKLEERLATQLPSKQRVVGSNPSRDATKLARATAFMNNNHGARNVVLSRTKGSQTPLSCKDREAVVTKLSDTLTTYKLFARAIGKHQLANPWDIQGYTR